MKKLAGIVPPAVRPRRRGEERRARPGAFGLHVLGRRRGVDDRVPRRPLPLDRGLDEDRQDHGGTEQQDACGRQAPRRSRRGARGDAIEPRGGEQHGQRGQRRVRVQARAGWRATLRGRRARCRKPRRRGRRSSRSTRRRSSDGAPSGHRPARPPRRPRRARRAAQHWRRKTASARRRRRDRRCWRRARRRRLRAASGGLPDRHR